MEVRVRTLLRDLVCLRRSEDETGSELLSLIEQHEPPSTGVSNAWDLREADERDRAVCPRCGLEAEWQDCDKCGGDGGEYFCYGCGKPPETGVSLPAQVEWLKVLVENIPKLFDPVMQPIAQTKLTAALATLRWVQGLKGESK